MQRKRLSPDPELLIEFYQNSLERLGALVERSWHDRLQILANGPAARVWQVESGIHESEIRFTPPGHTGTRDASRDVFPGCPLTFHLTETVLSTLPVRFRVILEPDGTRHPPDPAIARKLWARQFPTETPASLRVGEFKRVWHFSAVIALRTEVVAIEQNWFFNRMAFSLPNGEHDANLESELEFIPRRQPANLGEFPGWPSIAAEPFLDIIRRRLPEDLNDPLSAIKERQSRFLQRELDRIARYFASYRAELEGRCRRARTDDSRKRLRDRIQAATVEETHRRDDQLQRHEVRIIPHLDAVVLTAEPAWQADLRWHDRGNRRNSRALFVPRARRWFAAPGGDR